MALLALTTLTACYSHTGKPLDADQNRWHQLAIEACHRGDQSAYEALIARAGIEKEHRTSCQTELPDDDTTSVDHR